MHSYNLYSDYQYWLYGKINQYPKGRKTNQDYRFRLVMKGAFSPVFIIGLNLTLRVLSRVETIHWNYVGNQNFVWRTIKLGGKNDRSKIRLNNNFNPFDYIFHIFSYSVRWAFLLESFYFLLDYSSRIILLK